MEDISEDVAARASDYFQRSKPPPILTQAPGRVNLIGGHTDYNGGLVLPIAVDLGTYIAAYPRSDRMCVLYTENLDDEAWVQLEDIQRQNAWSDYVAGVARELRDREYPVCGMDAYIYSTVPVGGGLSSSAALEVSACLMWEAAGGYSLQPEVRARLCQRAENEFVGMHCGLMDQLTACIAREGYAACIDFSDNSVREVELTASVYFMVCDTNRPRDMMESAYNEIRDECEAAATTMGVGFLSELAEDDLPRAKELLADRQFKRVRHVVTENQRVRQATAALADDDPVTCGRLLNRSHASLRDDYRVSCFELEAMHAGCNSMDECYGARMVGGGFGGCVLALMDVNTPAQAVSAVAGIYRGETGLNPAMHIVQSAGGGRILRAP
ncbi:MAG: galactokinase [Armatimonadota bacterium]